MTQSITVACQLGPAYSASTISFKIYNIDGSQYAAWTSTGFSQIGTTGTYLKHNVSAPDAGGYIQFSSDGGSTVLAAVATFEALGNLATAASIAALPTAAAIVEAILTAGVADYEDDADAASLTELILAALESSRSSAIWTIRKTDGTTFGTRTLTLDADADPVTGVT